LTEQAGKALPKSPIGQAIAYARSNWAALLRYTEHGDLSIDKNLAAVMLRTRAIGRRTWTFLGSDRNGRTAAVLYLLRGHPQAPRHRSLAYLHDILGHQPTRPADHFGELLPDVWFASHPSGRRKTVA
jgi:hypothetical protein